ncbi:MAG TPA: glycosyltransferase [Candidatus Acidoferrales bacterium]|nr:glycosyltransferase [Candidatus Acidoferrales bacterium]
MTSVKPRLLITIYQNPDYYPPTVYAVRILNNYFNIHILCRNTRDPCEEWPADVTIERFGEYASMREKETANPRAKLTEYARFVARARTLVRKIHPAVIYSYDPHAFVAALIAQAGRRSTPVFFHPHELMETQHVPLTSLQTWVVKAAVLGTKWAAQVVFPEENRARIWLALAKDLREPIIVPNCPDSDYFRPPADWNDTIARRLLAREAVYVGNVGESNGHLEAIRAIARLDEPVRLRIIGSDFPEFEARMKALATDLGIGGRVSIDGWLRPAEVVARSASASLGLSLYKPVTKNLEYMGSASNKIFEYAAMGLPAVIPDRPSYRDFLGDAEWVEYVDVEDPQSIARAISSILGDRERYIAMSLAARRAFESRYNYKRVFAPALERILQLSGVRSPDQGAGIDENSLL